MCAAAPGIMGAATANVYYSTSRNKLVGDCVCWMCIAVSHPLRICHHCAWGFTGQYNMSVAALTCHIVSACAPVKAVMN